MLKNVSKIWQRLSYAGTETLTRSQSKSVVLTNRICTILALTSVIFVFPWALEGNTFMVLINLALVALYFGVIGMNARGWHDIPKYLMIFCVSTPVFVVTGMLGQKSLLHFSLIPIAGFSSLLFSRREKINILLAMGYPLLLLTILILADFRLFPNLVGDELPMLPAYDYILNFAIILSTMYCFYKAYSDAEDNFETLHKEHLKSQELLDEQRAIAIHSSKMVALGEMAGGIAHEINTPLFVIRSLSDKMHSTLVQKKFEENKFLEYTSTMMKMCQKMSSIVKSLSSFSHTSSPGPLEAVDLSLLIQETLVICQHRFYLKGVSVQVSCPADIPSVKCRPVEIGQILINLLNNAYDAVADVKDPEVKISAEKAGDSVRVVVEDNGYGIPEHVQQKIFNTFYTTKEAGKGTGLGLSISKKLVESNEGQLKFSSIPGSTRFILELAIFEKIEA